jgi:hypothetical protein
MSEKSELFYATGEAGRVSLKEGDYVLATKFADGDPCDQFCVGFVTRINDIDGRVFVVNGDGVSFRANGFRRAEVISPEEGAAIVAAMPQFCDKPGPSLWKRLQGIRAAKDGEKVAAGSACPIAGGTVHVNGQDMVTLSEFLRHTTKLTQDAGTAKRNRDTYYHRLEGLDADALLMHGELGLPEFDAGQLAGEIVRGLTGVMRDEILRLREVVKLDTLARMEAATELRRIKEERDTVHAAAMAAAAVEPATPATPESGEQLHGTFFDAGGPCNFQYLSDVCFPPGVHGFLRQCVKLKDSLPQLPVLWLSPEEKGVLEQVAYEAETSPTKSRWE